MGDLGELLEKMTIKFPAPISLDEIEKLFGRLAAEVSCDISYNLFIQSIKKHGQPEERNISAITGNIKTASPPLSYPYSFEVTKTDKGDDFTAIQFETYGYDNNIARFENLPGGTDKIRLVDELREATKKYFSMQEFERAAL